MTRVGQEFAEGSATRAGARMLQGTAQLTSVAESIAVNIIKKIDADIDNYRDKLAASKTDGGALDSLIKELGDIDKVDISFLKELDETTLSNMLKSQQSKRSRSKNKVMTLENYRNMMTAAIAENLIRRIVGSKKDTVGRRGRELTEEVLQELANDQEALRKEIRNVQSKKSIMRSKADFDENSEAWKKLLEDEEKLKALRISQSPREAIRNEIVNLIGDKDVNELKASEAKELLERVIQLAGK